MQLRATACGCLSEWRFDADWSVPSAPGQPSNPACSSPLPAAAFLRTVLAFMRPFVSKKAHRKIKQVRSCAGLSWLGLRHSLACQRTIPCPRCRREASARPPVLSLSASDSASSSVLSSKLSESLSVGAHPAVATPACLESPPPPSPTLQVQSVHDIAAATEGEVTLASLGPAFSAELLADEEKAAAAAAAEAAGGTAPAAGGSTGSSP